jgi:hypothetical protein
MRRREAGRGAVPAGLGRSRATRAAPGLRPGPLRDPARSWLTGLMFALPLRCLSARIKLKRGPPPSNTVMARREAPACLREGGTSYQIALFGAPSPSHSAR